MCIHIIYMYVCIYIYIDMFSYVGVCVCIYIYIDTFSYVGMCVSMCCFSKVNSLLNLLDNLTAGLTSQNF